MELAQLSHEYRASGDQLRARLRVLRRLHRSTQDREELWHLERRIYILTQMLRQVNELSELLAHYYEGGYVRNEKYTL